MTLQWITAGNNRGPIGLTGGAGPQGSQGPQGPSGVTTLRGATDYDDTVAPTDGQVILWVASGSKFKASKLPLVTAPPFTLAYAASLTPVATNGNYQVCTCTGAVTLNAPTGGGDGQKIHFRFIASGAQRTITFPAALKLTTGIVSTLIIPSGKRGDAILHFETADGWSILAASAQL